MPLSQSSHNATESAVAVPKPVWLLQLSFGAVLRLTSRDADVTYDSNTFTSALLQVTQTRPQPRIRLFNEGLTYGSTFMSEWADTEASIAAKLWRVFGDPPYSAGDADLKWDGFLGPGRIGQWIEFALVLHEPGITMPRIRATKEIFPRLPADGTEIRTRSGIVKLARNR